MLAVRFFVWSKQLPLSLRDRLDRTILNFNSSLIVNRVNRDRELGGPLFCVGRRCQVVLILKVRNHSELGETHSVCGNESLADFPFGRGKNDFLRCQRAASAGAVCAVGLSAKWTATVILPALTPTYTKSLKAGKRSVSPDFCIQ